MAPIQLDEQAIFEVARKIDSREAREAYLRQICGDNPAVHQRIQALLKAHEESASFLESPAVAAMITADEPTREGPGTVIGPYKLLEQIGEGGFGLVFVAEQSEPVRRKVALKILKPGMDTRQVVARFEAERQALAIMDHPNIARVFDGGGTPSGRPYFVMELVKGVSITVYCDQNHLTPRQRLELFVPVCQAVQHAHQKGIIHRDLKPSNILVSRHDTIPTVKVIDFGVAKALGQDLTDKTLFTALAQMVGTPLYMSPEQAGMSDLDIDTRSDIYSLGVLLYELLTGTTPFTKERFKQAAYDEIRRIIREEEPPKPSTRLSESKDSLPSISAQRQIEPARLTKLVRGELDWIVMKALEKDRNRRYETANGLALDIQRYLADEPVQACPPSAGYRFRKFVRRNKTALLVGIVAVATLIAAAIVLAISNSLIRQEQKRTESALEAEAKQRDRAEANFRLALQSLEELYTGFAEERLGHRPDLQPLQREFLQKALKFYEGFAQQNAGEAKAKLEIGKAYWRVGNIQQKFGDLPKAETALNQAIALLQELQSSGSSSPECVAALAGCKLDFGVFLMQTGKLAEAESAERQAIALEEKLVAENPNSPDYRANLARGLSTLGGVLVRAKRQQDALEVRQKAVDYLVDLVNQFPKVPDFQHRLAIAYLNLGYLHNQRAPQHGQWENPASESAYRKARTFLEKLVQEYPNQPNYRQDLALVDYNLGAVLHTARKLSEAEQLERESLSLYQKLADDFPGVTDYQFELARAFINLGLLLKLTERPKDAEHAFRQAILAFEKLVAAVPGRVEYRDEMMSCYFNLAQLLDTTAQYQDAQKLLREALERHPNTLNLMNQLAWMLANCADSDLRKPGEAVELAQTLVRAVGEDADAWLTLGVAQYRAGSYSEAVKALQQTLTLRGTPTDSREWIFLAMSEGKQGHHEQARKWYDLAAAWMEKNKDAVSKDSTAKVFFPRLHSEAAEILGIEKSKDEWQ